MSRDTRPGTDARRLAGRPFAHRRCGPKEFCTRILIIDDDRRSAIRLQRARPTLDPAAGVAGDAEQNGRKPGPETDHPFGESAVPLPERGTNPPLDLLSRGAVLDMDPELVRDVLERVKELLAQTVRPGADAEREAADEAGGITIDLPTQTVYRSGRPVRVTPTEFRLLVALVRRRGAVVSREDLRREVWPDGTEVQSRVIDSHIARLRRKLEDDPKQPRYILTALAAGYRFLA